MRTAKERFKIRQFRVRNTISKNSDRLRLTVFRSGRHIYAQIVNDANSSTLVSVSSLDKNFRQVKKSNNNTQFAIKVGQLLGQKAKDQGITEVVFDKSGYKYHGVVKALAEAARENLVF